MKNISILLLFLWLTPPSFAEGTEQQLELRQRDVVIKEMVEILLYSSKGKSKEELLLFPKNNPMAINNPDIVSEEGNYLL